MKQIQIIPAKTFEIKKDHKYLIIMPTAPENDFKDLQPAIANFFGSTKVLVIAAKDIDKIKVAEYMED